FFRGLIQPFLLRRTGNHHTAIWITAIIFSAIHLQFYGFFPRMFLGALFGYLMVWTGSLWAPILAHFANNAGAVAISYLFSDSQLSNKIEELGSSSDDWAYLVITAPIMYFLVKSIFNKREVIP
ncbi:MAG: CPBP family intramembrane glutamic endopeptidase, partial [Vicingaceae bacterium]